MIMLPEREKLPDLAKLNYEILEWIPTKSDGMARLVKARAQSGETVAIKIARVDEHEPLTEKHNQAILSESACLQSLSDCQGVVPVLAIAGSDEHEPAIYQTLDEEGTPAYLVQPFLAGATLSRFVGTAPISLISALRIAQSLAETLASVHERQWVHRDIKPNNIMFAQPPLSGQRADGAGIDGTGADDGGLDPVEEPILIDFGIAVAANTQIVAEGTISWMAPEVRQAFDNNGTLDAHPSCDIYGLGLILCYMLSGIRPTSSSSSAQNKEALIRAASSAVAKSASPKLKVDGSKVDETLNNLIHLLLHNDPKMRPTAQQVGEKISQVIATVQYPKSTVKRFGMFKKRYAPPLWRITGSIVVALFAIVLGRELLQAPATDDRPTEAIALSEETATPTIAPQQGFPEVQGDATATLLPPEQNSESTTSAQTDGAAGGDGQAENNSTAGNSSTNNSAVSNDRVASSNVNASPAGEDSQQSLSTAVPERSGLGWLPSFSFPGSLLSGVPGFAWLSTPVPTAVVENTPTPTPTFTVVATPTSTPFQYIFPETAAIVEITGNEHPCFQDWQMTDTWNKHAPGERISITWRRIGAIPFDAEAKFQIGIATDERGLRAFQAIPISEVVRGNEVLVDPLEAVWALNAIVNRNEVLNRPYVWGVFLVGASGRLVTRVSPICYFQLDGALEDSLPNE